MLNLSELRSFAKKNISGVTGGDVIDFRLEEAQENNDGNWEVVISFLTENKNPLSSKVNIFDMASRMAETPYERVFKMMLLDKNGNLLKLSKAKE